MQPTPSSLGEVSVQVGQGAGFGYLLSQFLDAFYRSPTQAALAVEPLLLTKLVPRGDIFDAYLAAVAESLAIREGWTTPPWVFAETRWLHRPYFSTKAAAFRATLLLESPPPFRSRNLFVTANAMSRV